MSIKVCYIISKVKKSLNIEWLALELDRKKVAQCYILLNDAFFPLEQFLIEKKIPVYRIYYRSKIHLPLTIIRLIVLLKKLRPDIVHTHLFDASLAGLIAAWFAGVKKRIHTRHHAAYHHSYHPHAVKYDRLINFLSLHIITISENVRNILHYKEKVPLSKISIHYHALQLDAFENVSEQRVENLRKKYDLEEKNPVIGVISRYTFLKGVQYIVPAYKKIIAEYPNACLLLANAFGDFSPEIKNLLHTLPKDSYRESAFEEDIIALYRLFDIFIHVPVDKSSEAYGLVYIEALASGIPSVVTISGIADEFIEDNKNALVVPFKDSESIYKAVLRILKDEKLKNRLSSEGKKTVQEKYNIKNTARQLEDFYIRL